MQKFSIRTESLYDVETTIIPVTARELRSHTGFIFVNLCLKLVVTVHSTVSRYVHAYNIPPLYRN